MNKKAFWSALIMCAVAITPIFLLSVLGFIGYIGRPDLKIVSTEWKDENTFVIHGEIKGCTKSCWNIGINIDGTPNKAIDVSDEGQFNVQLSGDALNAKMVKIEAYSYADYFGGSLGIKKVRIPDAP